MSILEALNTEVGNLTLCNKVLIMQGLDPTSDYSADNDSQIELAKAYCFKKMVSMPDFSEDGLSITYQRGYLISEANRIFLLNDLSEEIIDNIPTIKDNSGVW